MMIHPGYENVVNPTFTTIQQYTVEFFGKDAHAAGAPQEGINALDAQIQLFVNASTYRQQMVQSNRMHGVIKEGGFKLKSSLFDNTMHSVALYHLLSIC